MKKMFSLAVVLAALSVGCGNKNSQNQSEGQEQSAPTAETDEVVTGTETDDDADAPEAEQSALNFVDFEAEYEGKITRLSDYVGRGNYVLVDFWASWCRPCRMEIPNLIKAYNKYKNKGLVVLGVATWDEPDDTKQAIEQLNIPYPQILNAQYAGSEAYNIEGIPEIMLFDPDGNLLARGLRGPAIEMALSEIYD